MAQVWRYKFRKPDSFSWFILCSALNTREGAQELIDRRNREDRGRLEWSFDECLPGDFDYIQLEDS